MPRYRQKPIEAVQFLASDEKTVMDIFALTSSSPKRARTIRAMDGGKALIIHTFEGRLRVEDRDYLVKDCWGNLSVWDSDVFHDAHEYVGE